MVESKKEDDFWGKDLDEDEMKFERDSKKS
jgi:hypothetical protein